MKRTPLKRKTPLKRQRQITRQQKGVNKTMQAWRRAEARKLEELDKKWALDVKERDRHVCQRCGVQRMHQDAHHIVRRSIRATRHQLSNGVTLCRECHSYVHAHPEESRASGFIARASTT